MIEIAYGADLLDLGCTVLVDPCNCVGAFGRGVSAQIHSRWPEISQPYVEGCREGLIIPGVVRFSWTDSDQIIAFLPTKRHWRNASSLPELKAGLEDLARKTWFPGITVALPKVGCGLGGLDWESQVWPFVEMLFDESPQTVVLSTR